MSFEKGKQGLGFKFSFGYQQTEIWIEISVYRLMQVILMGFLISGFSLEQVTYSQTWICYGCCGECGCGYETGCKTFGFWSGSGFGTWMNFCCGSVICSLIGCVFYSLQSVLFFCHLSPSQKASQWHFLNHCKMQIQQPLH